MSPPYNWFSSQHFSGLVSVNKPIKSWCSWHFSNIRNTQDSWQRRNKIGNSCMQVGFTLEIESIKRSPYFIFILFGSNLFWSNYEGPRNQSKAQHWLRYLTSNEDVVVASERYSNTKQNGFEDLNTKQILKKRKQIGFRNRFQFESIRYEHLNKKLPTGSICSNWWVTSFGKYP